LSDDEPKTTLPWPDEWSPPIVMSGTNHIAMSTSQGNILKDAMGRLASQPDSRLYLTSVLSRRHQIIRIVMMGHTSVGMRVGVDDCGS
jgi:hypothetical protein